MFSLVEAYDGGFVFTGYSNSYSSGPLNLVIGKTDSLANLLWVNAYGSSGIDIGYEIINERDSGFLVIGNTYQNGSDEYFLFHVNDSGKVVGMPDWKERLDQVQVYPNPNKGIIRIVLPTKASGEFRLELFTLDGQCVYMDSQQQQYSNELVVHFGDYHTGGVYFLKITHLLENYYAKIFVTN
ncbi:MAG: T9SS type A sorting domain-containing protein [Bacteroidetes bacterium]|nr:T9SS type A sorting domain-containing protein [Bacteroidota bacterium]